MSKPTPKTKHFLYPRSPRIVRPTAGMHREDIKAELRKRGYTLGRVAFENGRHRSTITNALSHSWPAIEKLVADILECEPWEIWPERYNDYGQPVQPYNPNMVKIRTGLRRVNVEDAS